MSMSELANRLVGESRLKRLSMAGMPSAPYVSLAQRVENALNRRFGWDAKVAYERRRLFGRDHVLSVTFTAVDQGVAEKRGGAVHSIIVKKSGDQGVPWEVVGVSGRRATCAYGVVLRARVGESRLKRLALAGMPSHPEHVQFYVDAYVDE